MSAIGVKDSATQTSFIRREFCLNSSANFNAACNFTDLASLKSLSCTDDGVVRCLVCGIVLSLDNPASQVKSELMHTLLAVLNDGTISSENLENSSHNVLTDCDQLLCSGCAHHLQRVQCLWPELNHICCKLRQLYCDNVERHKTVLSSSVSVSDTRSDRCTPSITSCHQPPSITPVSGNCREWLASSEGCQSIVSSDSVLPVSSVDTGNVAAADHCDPVEDSGGYQTVAISIHSNNPDPGVSSISSDGVQAATSARTANISHGTRYKCKFCDKTFRVASRLTKHESLHSSGSSEYECQTCGKSFGQKYYLNEHVKQVHLGQNVHTCATCGKVFLRRLHLENHQRTHSGERPHVCHVCGRAFAQLGNLRAHSKLHQGIYPFQCDICGRRFRSRSNLDAHIRSHRGDKPHQCRICSASFLLKRSLVRHERAHTDCRPFKCDECDAAFRVECDLRSHVTTVHRVNSARGQHLCPVCGGAFSRRYKMADHMRRQHGDQTLRNSVEFRLEGEVGGAVDTDTVAANDCSPAEEEMLNSMLHLSQHSSWSHNNSEMNIDGSTKTDASF